MSYTPPLTKSPVVLTPGALELVNAGEPPRSVALEFGSGGPAPPPSPPIFLSRPIRTQRARLDQIQIGSGSLDPKLTALIR